MPEWRIQNAAIIMVTGNVFHICMSCSCVMTVACLDQSHALSGFCLKLCITMVIALVLVLNLVALLFTLIKASSIEK